MFGGLLMMRLRAAEQALRDGRIDEAHRLATAPDIRDHRRAAKVLEVLAERFLERARSHFDADRFTEALLDLDKGEAGGVALDRIAELRQQVRTVAAEVLRKEHSRQQHLQVARQRIERGSLEAGRQILDQVDPNDPEGQRLHREAQQRRAQILQMLEPIGPLVEQGQWAAAVDRLHRAKRLEPTAPTTLEWESRICECVLDRARQALHEGRPARAADELRCLQNLGADLPARRELEDMLRAVQTAAQALAVGRADDARQAVLRLQNRLPDAAWVQQTAEDLRTIHEKIVSLQAGPLGEPLAWADSPHAAPCALPPTSPAGLAETVRLDPVVAPVSALPDRLLLLIDGGGSFLVHRGERVSIGRAATSHPADVPIFSDLAERYADIARVEEDYFLFCPRQAEVNGETVSQRLLQDGDRVVLGRGARFAFRLPSRRSTSAVLDMSDGAKVPNDVRRVVLFHGHATIGRGPTVHFPCQIAREPLLLFERGGALWVRQASPGPARAEALPLELGKTIEVHGVGMTAKPWPSQAGGVHYS